MSKFSNKQLMQHVFAEMAKGNLDPFVDILAEDMKWSWMGTETWTRTFDGKEAVVNELLAEVKKTLTEPYEITPQRFIAEGNYLVIEHTGKKHYPRWQALSQQVLLGVPVFGREAAGNARIYGY